MIDPERRRRRVRHPAANEADSAGGHLTADPAAVHDPEPADDREVERGLRGLVGSGSSQVSTAAAMRARDAARAGDAELAAAEEQLVVVRRGWVPREDLPRGGGPR